MASNFNLFDFSSLGGVSTIVKTTPQVQGATGGGLMPPTISSQPLPQTQKPATKAGMFDTYMQDPKISKQGKAKMLGDLQIGKITEEDANGIIENIYKEQPQTEAPKEESFLGGALDKTIEGAKAGISRIGEAGTGLAEGKYNFAEAAMRGGAGALETAWSPISGVLGQGIQEGVSELSPETRQSFGEFANPKIEAVKEWYNTQTPEQKRNLDNIGVSLEVLANFVGAGAVQKSAPIIKQGAIKTGEALGKTGQAIAKTPGMIKKGVGAIDDSIETGVEKLAGKALGSTDGSKELFKATSPSYNTLSKGKDIKGIVHKAKQADEAIVEYGRKPTNTSERVTAYKDTMNDIWGDVEKARGSVGTKFNAKELSDTIDSEIQKLSVGGVINPGIQADINALKKQSDYFKKIGNIDIPTLGNQRTLINALTEWGATTEYGNTFSSVMKKVASKIRESEDAIIGSVDGGLTSDKLRKYGALRSMYDDVVKQDIKALRAKGMGIEESFGRIAGVSEALGGVAQIALNPKQALPTIISGGSKILLGKVAGKLKDPDYLIKTGYEKLSKYLSPKTIKNGTIRGNITTPSTNLNRAAPIGGIPKKQGQINLAQEKVKPGLITKPKTIVKKPVKK